MLKKVITIVLSLCLIFGIGVMTAGAVNETVPRTQQGERERPDGGRGGVPSGEFALPEGFAPSEGGFTPPESDERNNTETTSQKENEEVSGQNPQNSENSEESGQIQNGSSPFGGEMPEGMENFFGNPQNGQNAQTEQSAGFVGFVKTYSTPIISVVLLGLAYLFVIFYKRKNY